MQRAPESRMYFLRSILVVVVLAGTAMSVRAQPPTQEMPASDVTKWLGFFDKLVDAVVRNETSCDKMAADVGSVIDANHDSLLIARNARAAHKKLPESAQQHMLDGVKKMGPGIEKCGDNEKVKDAFAKLEVKDSAK
jgi:hypothetical protein